MNRTVKIFLAIVALHWSEHLAQAFQVWVLGWPRHQAGGLLGYWFPWLVHSEVLHWSFALFMVAGYVMLQLQRWPVRSMRWLLLGYWLSGWHLFEHTLLYMQASMGQPPVSVLQHFFPRIELHLFYNTITTIPLLAALWERRRFRRWSIHDRRGVRRVIVQPRYDADGEELDHEGRRIYG